MIEFIPNVDVQVGQTWECLGNVCADNVDGITVYFEFLKEVKIVSITELNVCIAHEDYRGKINMCWMNKKQFIKSFKQICFSYFDTPKRLTLIDG